MYVQHQSASVSGTNGADGSRDETVVVVPCNLGSRRRARVNYVWQGALCERSVRVDPTASEVHNHQMWPLSAEQRLQTRRHCSRNLYGFPVNRYLSSSQR